MTTLTDSELASRPVQAMTAHNFPAHSQDPAAAASALTKLVEHSEANRDVSHSIHAPMHLIHHMPSLHSLIPGIEKIATEFHVGNYVVVRATGAKFFESMPIYARLGMHLLFYGGTQAKLLHEKTVEHVLQEVSVRQGKIYDAPDSLHSIPSFIQTYSIHTDELLNPDWKSYKCFNDFFYRKLKDGARPVQNADDPTGICSAADCRLAVYPTVDLAKKFWIKGDLFTVPKLLGVAPDSEHAKTFEGSSVACFRLAPADYHRFHSPIDATVGETKDIPGEYYTVNPQAVNEKGIDVFSANRRSVLYLTHKQSGAQVAFVAIGAMMVGSVRWTRGAEAGREVARGEELGYFAYGGSTVVVLFPRGVVEFDEDLVRFSEQTLETQVKVGWSIAHARVAQ